MHFAGLIYCPLHAYTKDKLFIKTTTKETIFYAFSGGQESDSGSIGGYFVYEAKKEDKSI